VQQLPCHGSYCELILSLARTSCRLSFPPALLPLREPAALQLARSQTCSLWNSSKSTLAHDAVAAVVLHKHHLTIRVGAGLIQFVYGLHSRMAADLTLYKNLFLQPFSRVDVCVWQSHRFSSESKLPLCHQRCNVDTGIHRQSHIYKEQWRKQHLRIFGPKLIRTNEFIKTARNAVSTNRMERGSGFCGASREILKTWHS